MRKPSVVTLTKYRQVIDAWFSNDFDIPNAYKSIYPTVKKDSTARVNFSKLKAMPEIASYIEIKREKAAKVVEAEVGKILKELLNWLEADITETIGLTAEQLKRLPIQLRRLINKYEYNKKTVYDKDGNKLFIEENIKLGFVSKEKAMDMINKHIGFYEKDNGQKKGTIEIHASDSDAVSIIEDIINGK